MAEPRIEAGWTTGEASINGVPRKIEKTEVVQTPVIGFILTIKELPTGIVPSCLPIFEYYSKIGKQGGKNSKEQQTESPWKWCRNSTGT